MKILPVTDPSFRNYGQVLEGYDLKELLETLDKVTPCPEGVDYVPEQAELQALPIEKELRNRADQQGTGRRQEREIRPRLFTAG